MGARWQLERLPGEGPIGQQDAKLMEALECIRQVRQALLARAAAESRAAPAPTSNGQERPVRE